VNKKNKKIKELQKEADSLWKQRVREHWGNLCTVCGKIAADPHHCFLKGSHPNLRYDILNGVPLCRECHTKIHANDPIIKVRIIKRRGVVWYRDLERRSKEPSKYKSAKYYREIIELLQL